VQNRQNRKGFQHTLLLPNLDFGSEHTSTKVKSEPQVLW
jgi:hypothetical protein